MIDKRIACTSCEHLKDPKGNFLICAVWDEIDDVDKDDIIGTLRDDCPRFSMTEEVRIANKSW